jgi:hypothetical protein
MVKQVIRNKRQGRKVQSVLAKLTGGKSVGTIEGQDISYKDKPWSVEAKHRKSFIGCTFMEQAEKNAPPGKTPVVMVHTKGKRYDQSLVIIRLADWLLISESRE